jgi:pimeloyl-CoA synthetase
MAVMEPGNVTYTVKELIEKLGERLDRIEAIMLTLATKSHVEKVDQRVVRLEADSIATKKVADALLKDGIQKFSKREKIAGLVFACISLFLGVLALGPDIIPYWG